MSPIRSLTIMFKHKGAPPSGAAMNAPLERAWRRCAIAFLIVFFGGIGLIFAFLLVVDPYDTGRFPTPPPTGVVDNERRTATASRRRDPRFNAAIFGNSRTFMLDPAKLSEPAGLSFVSLRTPASGPREEMLMTRYFLRFHPGAEAIVFGIDERWCSHDPAMPLTLTFHSGPIAAISNIWQIFSARVRSTRRRSASSSPWAAWRRPIRAALPTMKSDACGIFIPPPRPKPIQQLPRCLPTPIFPPWRRSTCCCP